MVKFNLNNFFVWVNRKSGEMIIVELSRRMLSGVWEKVKIIFNNIVQYIFS